MNVSLAIMVGGALVVATIYVVYDFFTSKRDHSRSTPV
jgi:hypothetical protein